MRPKTKGPLMLLSAKDRDNRSQETTFSQWEADVNEMIPRLIEMMGKLGIEMTELDVVKYLAWGAEVSIARIAWVLGDEMKDLSHVMSSLAEDLTRRYMAHRKGEYEAPEGWPHFETIEEYEEGLADRLGTPKRMTPPTGAPEYVPGGYL